jgi:FtsH-binding integral membrane protein
MNEIGDTSQQGLALPPPGERAFGGYATARDQTRAVFGQVMGLVALTVGCATLGAYLARNFTGGTGIALFIGAFACIFGLNIASSRGHEQLAIGFLFGMGLLLGAAVGPVLSVYAHTDPAALWQATGATAGFVALLGTYGYATRRDLSAWARTLFWALLGLIAFGIVLLFVTIPNGNIIYGVLGLVIFGGFTIFDFNRLRRARSESAVAIAASIFLDIFNIFLLFLNLFGGQRE